MGRLLGPEGQWRNRAAAVLSSPTEGGVFGGRSLDGGAGDD